MSDRISAHGSLESVETAFRLLAAGPRPLSVHASRLAPGLPDRPVPVDELRVLLLHPATSHRARNKVWAELVRRRSGDSAWTVALAGIAMPGLRRATAALAPAHRGDSSDLQSEILAGFLAALKALDLDDLEQVPLAARLCWAARRAGEQATWADARHAFRRADLGDRAVAPALPWGHPDFVLASAIDRGVVSAEQAELVGRNRLEGVPLSQIAKETGISHSALCNRRKRAEKAIASAIASGLLSE